MPNEPKSPHRLIVEHATEGMVLLEHESDGWICRLANPAFGEAVGREAADLEGGEVADIVPTPMAERLEQQLSELDPSGPSRHWSYRPDDAERRSWQVRLQPLAGEDPPRILLVLREVTDQARRAARAESDRRALQRLYEVAGRTDLGFSHQLRELLQVGCARLNLPLGFITRLTDETQHIVEAVGDHPAIAAGETCPIGRSYCRKTLESDGGLVTIRNAPAEGWEGDPAYEEFELHSYIGAKIIVDDDLTGTVCFAGRQPHPRDFDRTDRTDRTFLRLIAQWIRSEIERHRLISRLAERARTDGLTGLSNHESFIRRLETEIDRADRYEHALSLLLLDLDHFKKINDRYGHPAGDEVLRRFAGLLRRETRSSDTVGRYGGEEFAIILPNTELEEALQLGERILEACRAQPVEVDGQEIAVTCSIGVAEARAAVTAAEPVLQRADAALYDAKHQGRDRVVAADR